MSKFSVKKPFTVLMVVFAAIIIGVVSLTKMQLDLLPEVSLPYLMVITTYPGASAEAVETEVVKPMEGALGTINGVKNVYGDCEENYGLIELEFQDDVNIDSAMVKVSSALNTLESSLPEDCGTPSVIELGTDMLASVYLAVSMDNMSIEELSQFVEDEITPQFEKQNGVASVSELGLVDKSIQVELNEDKINVLNDKILGTLDSEFADAVEQLDDAKKQLNDSAKTINKNKDKLIESQQDLEDSKKDLKDSQKELDDSRDELESNKSNLESGKKKLEDGANELNKKKNDAYKGLTEATYQLDLYSAKMNDAKSNLFDANIALETAKASHKTAQNELAALNDELSAMNPADDPTAYSAKQADISSKESEVSSLASDVDTKQAAVDDASTILSDYKTKITALENQKLEASTQFGSLDAQMTLNKAQLESAKAQLDSAQKSIDSAQKQIDKGWESVNDGQDTINDSWEQITDGEKQLSDGWGDYRDAVKTYEKQRAEAVKKANADDLLTLDTLSQLIYAQNFEMPAGYIDDELDNSWLVKVGQNFEEVDEVGDIVLCNIHNVGDVKLNDVADITVIDNADDSYVRLGTDQGVILSIFKASTAGTNDVSKVVRSEIETLKAEYPGLEVMVLSDQGDYINLIVKSVLQSMLIGAALAIFVLAIFLKDFKPTVVVALSIPLSVFLALICMYFSNISLNMLSLSGLALGIGMLVDNSIVVIENIYRLRSRGVDAPRAAVQGTKQVAGAIISSTLTTVCVFLPMIYTTGIVRELMIPMCLTIVYCLAASLVVAMTVVPAAGSTILRKAAPKEHKIFDKIQDAYGKALDFCLNRKALVLLVAVGLLGLTGWLVIRMGVVMIPEMTMNTIEASIEYDEEAKREDCYRLTDEVIEKIVAVDGVGSVGVMAGGDETLMVSAAAENPENFRSMSFMILTENPDAGEAEIKQIMKDIEKCVEGMDVDFEIATASSEMDSMMGGSGLSIPIYGDDIDELLEVSHDVMDIIDSVDGYTNISNGEEDADKILHLNIDKNKAMSMGLSVAQIFQELNTKMTSSKSAVTVTIDGIDMDIKVVDEIDQLTKENILDYSFTVDAYDEDDDKITEEHTLGEFATVEIRDGVTSIDRKNMTRYMTVTADVEEGYNITLLTRELEPLLEEYELPSGYSMDLGGEYDSVVTMLKQMALVVLLGLAFIYMVMVAQFQSLLSPFIVMFTIPLAFTGGFLGLWLTGENLSVISIMGFVVLMGTVVNNGIVFVDYTNQLRKQGLDRRTALIATGKTRMRPIMMTALTTILAESNMIFGDDMGAQLGRGMALVIAGGLLYATLMTLFVIPIMYDIMFKKQPLDVDTGSESLDDIPDDAADYLAMMAQKNAISAKADDSAQN